MIVECQFVSGAALQALLGYEELVRDESHFDLLTNGDPRAVDVFMTVRELKKALI